MSRKQLILLTGASGYIGAHIVQQAIEAGYSIRATARRNKVEGLKNKFGGKIEVVPFDDLVNGDYTDILKGVDAVLHVAAPLPWAGSKEQLIDGAVNGSMNILRQSAALGIKRIVITSSFVTVVNPEVDARTQVDKIFTDNDWNTGTREQVLNEEHTPFFNYSVAKTIAEREIWEFADAHPEVDITTLNPPFVFGPHFPGGKFPKGDITALSSAGTIFYTAIFPEEPSTVTWKRGQTTPAQTIDVRDLARAHILALEAPLAKEVGRKRILISGARYAWFDAVKYLHETRPELRSRLAKFEDGEEIKLAKVDNSRAGTVLGMTQFIGWRKTVDDTVDFLLQLEKEWERANF